MEYSHLSVMADECVAALRIDPDGTYVDSTMGGGGHSLLIAERLLTGRLVAIDRDEYAHERAREKLAGHLDKITFIKDNFSNIDLILSRLGIDSISGVLMDLGVSSFQLDDASRGFSYRNDAPLDMRMSKSDGLTAYDVVNGYGEDELARILFEYGEEKFARRIAGKIVLERREKPIATTTELAEIVRIAIPAAARREGGHPARRSFQAIRIEVNGELEIIEGAIRKSVDRLVTGGRIAVLTFHSLEDRIVKNTFAALAKGCTCPPDFPVCVCGKKPIINPLFKKPITAGEDELGINPRSRSAKLRAAERI